jgi:diguanylate cyclase (GGDEF)-like protein/PAS domain S-box-containing protein
MTKGSRGLRPITRESDGRVSGAHPPAALGVATAMGTRASTARPRGSADWVTRVDGAIAACGVAVVIGGLGMHLTGRGVGVAVLAGGAAVLLALVVIRLRLLLHAADVDAAREVVLRRAAGELSCAVDGPEVHDIVLDAAAALIGGGRGCVAVASRNDRGVYVPDEVRALGASADRARFDVADVLAGVPDELNGALRSSTTGSEAAVLPFPTRLAGRRVLVAIAPGLPPELDSALGILCTQAGFVADGIAQVAAVQAERTEARFRELVRHSSDAIMIAGRDGRITYQTPSVVRVLGYLAVDLDQTPVGRLVHPDHTAHFDAFLGDLLRSPAKSVRTVEVRMRRADGAEMHAEIVGSNLLDLPEIEGLVLTVRDMTSRRMLEDQLRHQAFHDSLTGLANRSLFVDRVEHALERTGRSATVATAVAYVDLDDFKTVNDSLGHGAGDELLMVVADRLRGCVRPGDTPARLGGDEFAVLIEDATELRAIIEVADRVLEALQRPVTIDGTAVSVRASVGVATAAGQRLTTAELLRNADLAMYAAKAAGKGRVEVFEPEMHQRAVDRLSITSELERSLAEGRIGVAYQPIVELATRRIVGFEALARWSHPTRGPVAPAEFVPIAEETGLILPLGRQVLERACQQLARWRATELGRHWRVSVNVSARQLLAPDLVVTVEDATSRAGLEPAGLTLELTESVLLSDSERVLERLHALKQLGVQVALDDFGTGYSSLSYLQRVPFDLIKIDRVFVQALRAEAPATSLASTIVDLARTLGRLTVAEGIEDEVEAAGLQELGCQLGQGYLFGRPLAPGEVEEHLGLFGTPRLSPDELSV